MKSKRLGIGLIAAVSIAVIGILFGTANAWPAPTVTGDCDSWTVTETAPNYDWTNTEYWTIDGVAGHFTKGQSVNVPDDSTNTSRTFTVRWYDDDDHQLDSRSKTGNRVLEGCTPPPEPTASYSGSVDCDGMVSGSGSVNRDGLEGNLVVTVNGVPATVVGDNFTFNGAAQPLTVVVKIGDADVLVEGALVGPPPGGCDDPDPEPEPDPDPVPEPVPPTL